MHKIMYDRALFILHKNVKPSYYHDVIKKKYLIHTQKKIISFFRKCQNYSEFNIFSII